MTQKLLHGASGVIVGLLLLSLLGFFFDAVISFRPAEPLIALVPLTLALGLMAILPVRSADLVLDKPRGRKLLWLIIGILVSVAVATVTIRGDIRSWFLVALVVMTALLLSIPREQ